MKYPNSDAMSCDDNYVSSNNSTRSEGDNWFPSSALMNLDEFLDQVAYHDNLSGHGKMRPDQVVRVDFSQSDLALATSPTAVYQFDPSNVKFNEDELKPQPIMAKSRKTFVPETMKDGRYWARRAKNNVAAKRSREARRLKENQIFLRANYLEKENSALKETVDRLMEENLRLKQQMDHHKSES